MNKLLLVSLMGAAAWIQSASAATLYLTPSTLTPTVGQTFTIEVGVTNTLDGRPGDDVIAFGFDLTNSNNTVASFLSLLMGPLWDDISGSYAGTDVNGIPAGLDPITDDPLLLATLTFTALQPGTVTLGVSSDVITPDPNEGLVYFIDTDANDLTGSLTFNVLPDTAIPEPSTIGLGALGLLSLALLRRRS